MTITSVVIAAKTKQTATIFWFHGLGDSGAGWSFLAQELSNLFPYVKWVLPNAYAFVFKDPRTLTNYVFHF